ncbi:hypothetical protein KCP71_16895 [Salmonella enterica subsp. enterica]|nr:hypothetical protein KCP71_16895 [Salmonella enterica subsp. enterica]
MNIWRSSRGLSWRIRFRGLNLRSALLSAPLCGAGERWAKMAVFRTGFSQ